MTDNKKEPPGWVTLLSMRLSVLLGMAKIRMMVWRKQKVIYRMSLTMSGPNEQGKNGTIPSAVFSD